MAAGTCSAPSRGPSKRVLLVCPIPLRTGMRRREEMKTLARWMVCICLLGGASGRLSAQESAAPAGQSEDKTPTSYDMKAQAALDLQQLQLKFTSLAQAIPQEKYSWRPDAESRSIAEMLLHTAGAGFGFPKMLDVATPAGFDGKGFDKTTTDKAKIIEWLNKSFAHSISAANGMANADARSVGVVPPWTADALKKSKGN